jgi:hypothetical protein
MFHLIFTSEHNSIITSIQMLALTFHLSECTITRSEGGEGNLIIILAQFHVNVDETPEGKYVFYTASSRVKLT